MLREVGIIFMNLSEAFNCLPYDIILAKLHAYDIDYDSLKLIKGYSSNQHRRIKHELVLNS